MKREIKDECISYILNTWRSTQKLKDRVNSQGCTTDTGNNQSKSPSSNSKAKANHSRRQNNHQLANLGANDVSRRYHVYLRGVRHDTVFYDNQDRVYFLVMLDQAAHNHEATIFAFILMDNHLHIQIETDRLSLLMKDLLARYSRWYNRKYGWDGSVFRRPFGRSKIYSDLHAIDNLLYILGNAFREQICPTPSEYLWTSYNFHPQICALKKEESTNDISKAIKIDASLMVENFQDITQLDYTIISYVPKRYFNKKSTALATADASKKPRVQNTFAPRIPVNSL